MKNPKMNIREILVASTITFFMGLLFFILKLKCKLALPLAFKELGFEFYDFYGLSVFILISAIISYIMAKLNQYVWNNDQEVNLKKFACIFTVSMVTTTFFLYLGFPLFYLLVNSGVVNLLFWCFSYLYQEDKFGFGFNNYIMDYLMASNNENNNNNSLNSNSNSETERFLSTASSTGEVDGLNKSLSKIENNMELVQTQTTNTRNLIQENIILHNKYKTCSKILWYIPYSGNSLYDIFTEASLNHKQEVLNNQVKLAEYENKFHELRNKRLEVLDKLAVIENNSDSN